MKRAPYSEEQAKVDAQETLRDLERARVRLRSMVRGLKTLPGYKRVDEAWKNGHEEEGSFAWELYGGCLVYVEKLEEEVIRPLRADLRETDATVAAANAKADREIGGPARREREAKVRPFRGPSPALPAA